MENLVQGLLNGQSDLVTIPIQLKVPRALYQTYQLVAQQLGVSVQQALENLANQGIQNSLNNSIGRTTQPDIDDLAKQQGLDLSGLTEGLGKLQSLMTEINKLQKVFPSNESGDPPKDQ